MKKIALLLLFTTLGLSTISFAQSRQSNNGLRKAEEQNTVYVQIVGQEEFNSPEVKMRAYLGKDNQFYVKDKRDFEIYDILAGEIANFTMIPDALNYLAEKGFVVVGYTTNTIGDRIRHNILLSRTTTM